MTAAANLLEAASLTNTNLAPKWAADTLQTAVIAFANDLYEEFPSGPDGDPNNAPIANWLAVIGTFAPTILDFVQETAGLTTTGVDTIQTYETASDYVYRLCKFAYTYNIDGFITNDQADAILAAYNARFG